MNALENKAKIITFSSGKGGVGKTCTAVNLSILLAQKGFRVCLFDAD
ncbi:MAG: ParA family protein, partial [Gammaproteobacteria bacterium]|nr:ParA family protein [Gammaproteobacteria bacterium]